MTVTDRLLLALADVGIPKDEQRSYVECRLALARMHRAWAQRFAPHLLTPWFY